jgi:hypothetical protein
LLSGLLPAGLWEGVQAPVLVDLYGALGGLLPLAGLLTWLLSRTLTGSGRERNQLAWIIRRLLLRLRGRGVLREHHARCGSSLAGLGCAQSPSREPSGGKRERECGGDEVLHCAILAPRL